MIRFTLFFCLFLFACRTEVATPTTSDGKVLFDLPSFFQKEIDLLQPKVTVLEKTATINGITEVQRVENFELEKELSIFSNADINKATWVDQYQVDSTWQETKQLKSVQYTALNENLKTKQLTVSYDKGVVSVIEIQKGIDNMAIESNQILKYFPKKGYSIKNEQSMVLSNPQKVEVEVKYIW